MAESVTGAPGFAMPSAKTMRTVGALIVLIGAVLLIAALFTPWYAEKTSYASVSETGNFYPGFPSQNGTIQYSCSGVPACPAQTSYTNEHLNNTGNIAETGFFLLIVGVIFGVIAAVFGFMARGSTRRVRPAMILAIIALILALIAPILFAAALPGAISSDIPTAGRPTSSGPWSSFIGSTSYTFSGVTISLNWGPTTGWYIAFVAFVLFLVGLIFLFRARREEPAAQPAAMAPPMASPPTQ